MCRSAQRRGRAHRAHPRNHGDAEHPAEQDGGGHLRTAETAVGGRRPHGKDAVGSQGEICAARRSDAGGHIERTRAIKEMQSTRRSKTAEGT
ncbi:unnamed protein product [Boreogadus saida]